MEIVITTAREERRWEDLSLRNSFFQFSSFFSTVVCYGEEQISRCPGVVWNQSLSTFIFWPKVIPDVCVGVYLLVPQ